jgi:endo-1,4-beta-xylanase
LSHFERFGLPIHFTENTLLSGELVPPEIDDLQDAHRDEWPSTPDGEVRQMEEVVTHYKTLMANPNVEAVVWWDLSDGAWLNAPSGMLRRDQTPKPAYDALLKLVKGEWWLPPTTFMTDANGQISFTGFLGDYALTVGETSAAFSLENAGEAVISLAL